MPHTAEKMYWALLLHINLLFVTYKHVYSQQCHEDGTSSCDNTDEAVEVNRWQLNCIGKGDDECVRLKEYYSHAPEYRRYEHAVFLKPNYAGEVTDVNIVPGKTHQMIAKAVDPPIYEIPNFLSDEECEYVKEKALATGMVHSRLFGANPDTNIEDLKGPDVFRISRQTWLHRDNSDTMMTSWKDRIEKLTKMPRKYIEDSEPFQVVNYGVGGHYHAHTDSASTGPEEMLRQKKLPCCYQTNCPIDENVQLCCKVCRYMTLLVYLNDVEEGGQTAYPFADLPGEDLQEKLKSGDYLNLSRHCGDATIAVRPRKGMAVMWYNHAKDPTTGLIGDPLLSAYHGSCDVTKGEKWIANMWISVPPYEHWDKPSSFNT
ncbi:hypothetical protein ScPMuIL_000750 [Solemya velum]